MQNSGTVAIWGGNGFGQLGNGYSVHRLSPVQIGGDANWRAASGGLGFFFFFKIDNTLWAWGDNSFGQLGIEGVRSSAIPLQVGSEQNWDKAAAGEYHAFAIKTDGSLWGWGHNDRGQLGDGSTTDRSAPVRIAPGTVWFAVSAGQGHTLGIQADGSLWAWGRNDIGQVGDGTNSDSVSPVHIGQASTWIAVAAGQQSSYAIRSDGTLWAWGAGESGELGNGSWASSAVPVLAGPRVPLSWYAQYGFAWQSIAAGSHHAFAFRRAGELCAWGKNDHGQITDGWSSEASNMSSPLCPDGAWDWVLAAAGQDFSLGRKKDGTIWSWGNNDYGQLGDGTVVERHEPGQIGLDRDWAFIAAGKQHALAIKTDSTLWSWGYNSRGQAGTGDLGAVPVPAVMSDIGAIRINGGAALTNNPMVSLGLSAIDRSRVVSMQFSNDGTVWSPSRTVAVSTYWDVNNDEYGGVDVDGEKTVYAKFQDAAGNESTILSAAITLDTTPPSVVITSPVDGATYHALPVLLYTVSEGAALVTISGSDPAFESLSSGSPLQYMGGFLRGGWQYVGVRATDAAGNTASANAQFNMEFTTSGGSGVDPDEGYPNCNGTGKFIVGPSNFTTGIIVPAAGSGQLNIAAPENFSTINASKVIVKGAMDTVVPIKSVAVVVSTATGSSSYAAQVNGKYFAAKVPVAADATITVIATDQTGTQHQDSVSVYVNAQGDGVDLSAGPNMGVQSLKLDGNATLDVKLISTVSFPQPARYYAWDLSGTGYNDLTCWSHSSIQVSYQHTGLYESQVLVEAGDRRYRDSVIVNVLDRDEMDAIFKPIWNGMKEKLAAGDGLAASDYFHPAVKAIYAQQFNETSATLPLLAEKMGAFSLVKVRDYMAEYDLRSTKDGVEYSFQVLFMRDGNGNWGIFSF